MEFCKVCLGEESVPVDLIGEIPDEFSFYERSYGKTNNCATRMVYYTPKNNTL